MALVIGNSNYQEQSLRNPTNDARDISAVLRSLGFEIDLRLNASQEDMEGAVQRFGRKLQGNTVGLFYYSGHGVQHEGSNYLIPIGAMSSVSGPDHLRYKTVDAGYVLGVMKQAGNGLNIVVLDACRNNPFKSFSRSMNKGLKRISGAEGTIIAYSTSPGKVALDGTGRNSPYTEQLIKLMKKPNLPVEIMFKQVRRGVKSETGGKQLPWYEASIDGDFFFKKEIVDSIESTASDLGNTWDENERLSRPSETDYHIVTKNGLRRIKLGSTSDVGISILGKPNKIQNYDNGIYHSYDNISLVYDHQTRKLKIIFIEKGFPAKTDKGVMFGDSIDKVISLYGEPTKMYPDNKISDGGWLKYKNHGILFDYHERKVDGFDVTGN